MADAPRATWITGVGIVSCLIPRDRAIPQLTLFESNP